VSDHGVKSLRGRKFSKLLRDIGEEATEICGDDPKTGEVLFITKAESLARTMWQLALGWEERVETKARRSGEPSFKVKRHKPDTAILKELLERLEGRAGTQDKQHSIKPVSRRIAEQAKSRVNTMTQEA
jgi:hypothetical protein